MPPRAMDEHLRHQLHTGDGREGTAIFEVTGARHHRFFPEATPARSLPS